MPAAIIPPVRKKSLRVEPVRASPMTISLARDVRSEATIISIRRRAVTRTREHVGLNRAAKDRSPFEDLPKVVVLAKLPNVALKASGMPSLSAQSYPFRDLHPYIRQLVDAFSPRRTFWGTDLTRMPCSYRECITLFTEELPWLKGADLERVMGRGVCEWLGWPLPAA